MEELYSIPSIPPLPPLPPLPTLNFILQIENVLLAKTSKPSSILTSSHKFFP